MAKPDIDYGHPDSDTPELEAPPAPDLRQDTPELEAPQPVQPELSPGASVRPAELGPAPPALEPVLLPKPRYLVPGQFGKGSIQGVKILYLTRKHERAVLEACSISANLSQACKRAGVSYRRVHTVMASNPAFKARVKEHLDFAIDRLEQASLRRAIVGHTRVRELLDHEGNVVQVTVHDPPSDRLAVKILEARRPEVYGRGREPGTTHVTQIALMPRSELERHATIVEAQCSSTPKLPDKSNT